MSRSGDDVLERLDRARSLMYAGRGDEAAAELEAAADAATDDETTMIVEDLARILRGERPLRIANPEVLP